MGMESLIKACQIFKKYSSEKYLTHCDHDVFYVFVNPHNVSATDVEELEVLGFHADYEDEKFYSHKYGSC